MKKEGAKLREKVLLVADRRSQPDVLADLFSNSGYSIAMAEGTRRAFDVLGNESPDLVVIDSSYTRTAGLEICFHLKANSFTFHIPIVILGTSSANGERVQWYNHGADVCLDSPFHPAELVARIRSLLRRAVEYDHLTHLPTPAYVHRQVDSWLANNLATAVLYVEIDHLPEFMTTYGQEAGDRVIVQLAKLIVDTLPTGEVAAAHLGNGRFMAMVPLEGSETITLTIVQQFRVMGSLLYPSPFSQPGYNELIHLLGNAPQGPALTLSAVLVTNENRLLLNYVQVSTLVSQTLRKVKQRGGNGWEKG